MCAALSSVDDSMNTASIQLHTPFIEYLMVRGACRGLVTVLAGVQFLCGQVSSSSYRVFVGAVDRFAR